MIKIIEHYIVFAGSDLLQSHATSLESIVDTIVGNADDKGLLTTLPIIDLLVLMFPQEVLPLISSALQKLVFISLSGGDEHYPSRTAVCVTSAAILARLLLLNRDFLAQLLSEPALIARFQQAGINQNLLLLLVDWWINKVCASSRFSLRQSINLHMNASNFYWFVSKSNHTCFYRTSTILYLTNLQL
jgi:hypothetical protein